MARQTKDDSSILRFARETARRDLGRLTLWHSIGAALRMALAAGLALLAGRMIGQDQFDATALTLALTALTLAALAGAHTTTLRAQAEARLGQSLRQHALTRLAAYPSVALKSRAPGAMIAGIERYPAQIARLTLGYAAATRMTGIGPLLAAAAIALVSWQAALVLLLVSPVMVIFFVLVGGLTAARASAQEAALARLAAQFGDRVRALPTILSNAALATEEAKLGLRMQAYARATLSVLRVAFLNSAVTDFFSALSIAILAVFLGLGHLGLIHLPGFSDLLLWQSLFLLMLAPEYFAPFRKLAENYHAKAEGAAAAEALNALLTPPETVETLPEPVRARVVAALTEPLPARGLIAVTGPSGCGKSTLLRALAGLEPDLPTVPLPAAPTWVSGEVLLTSGSLAAALSTPGATPEAVEIAAAAAGLLDDPFLPQGLKTALGEGGDALSGGQRMRIALARALLALGPVLADEPTAKLDPNTAARLRASLRAAAQDRLVIVATHELGPCRHRRPANHSRPHRHHDHPRKGRLR